MLALLPPLASSSISPPPPPAPPPPSAAMTLHSSAGRQNIAVMHSSSDSVTWLLKSMWLLLHTLAFAAGDSWFVEGHPLQGGEQRFFFFFL